MELSTYAMRISHCIIHQEVQCYRFFFNENEISNRHCGFNSGLHFLEEAGSKYADAVHYLAVRWLDKSAMLNRHLHF
jgi:hypothetical protein